MDGSSAGRTIGLALTTLVIASSMTVGDARAKPRAAVLETPVSAESKRDSAALTAALEGQVEWVPLETEGEPSAFAAIRDDLDKAREALSSFDNKTALEIIAMAEGRLATALIAPETAKHVIDLHIIAARALLSEGKKTEATRRWRLVHQLDPTLTGLDPKLYPPELDKSYRRAISSKPKTRTVAIATEPAEARLLIDGREMTGDRERLRLSRAPHYISVSAPGFAPRTVTLAPRATSLEVKLTPLTKEQQRTEALARARAGSDIERMATLADLFDVDVLFVVRGSNEATVLERSPLGLAAWQPIEDAARLLSAPATNGQVGSSGGSGEAPSIHRSTEKGADNPARGRVTAALRVGAGSLACQGCEGTEVGVAGGFDVGFFVRPRLAVLYDASGWYEKVQDTRILFTTHTLAGRFSIVPSVWLRGGAGLSVTIARAGGLTETRYAPAISAAAGIEIYRARRVTFELSVGGDGTRIEGENVGNIYAALGGRFR